MQKQNDFQEKLQKCMIGYEKNITANMKSNPKRFFSYLSSKRKIKESLNGIKDPNGNLLGSPSEVADELGKFFKSTFIVEEDGDIPKLENQTEAEINDLQFAIDEVKKLLCDLNISKSIGPDNVHPKLLKALGSNIDFVESLTLLFQKCYDCSQLPKIWKSANITALHKKGDKSESCNYRPISITSTISKIFEKIVRNHILQHVYPFIVQQQHGFLPKVSCISNLLECMNVIYDILEDDECVDVLYLDFQKAFDTVGHKRLLSKLEAYGVTGRTKDIVKDFLTDRYFRVKVGSTFSKNYKVTSGVPQGPRVGTWSSFVPDLYK